MEIKNTFNENPDIINKYLDYIQNTKNFSIGTINGYELDLKIFFKFILKYKDLIISYKDITIFTIAQIKNDDITAYLVYLNYHKSNCSNTRQRKIAALKSFFKWFYLNNENICDREEPTKHLPSIQSLKRLPKYLSLKQAKDIQNIFNEENCKQYARNNTIITLFLTTGIRLSELIKINISDIDFDNNSVFIHCKGNKDRKVYFPTYCKNRLLEYIDIREKYNCSDSALFISSQNRRISKSSIENICREAYKLMHLEDKKYTVHTLRHTAATIYFEYNNRDILLLKELLGHSTILSTEIYAHTYNDLVKNAVEKNPLSEYGM